MYVFTDIDDCIGVTCQHEGVCEDGVNQYTCRCTPGYTGTYCETSKSISTYVDMTRLCVFFLNKIRSLMSSENI